MSIVLASSASAHHSATAEYDFGRAIAVEGVVVELQWSNPHAYLVIEVTEYPAGKATWKCEMSSPFVLARRGWSPERLAKGTLVAVSGAPARDGSRAINAESVVLRESGEKLLARSTREQQEAEAAAAGAPGERGPR